MEKKNNESKNGFLQLSDNLTELMGPVLGWIWKHSITILLVVAVIGFVWRSILHYYVDSLAFGESLSTAAVELISIYAKWLLIGFAALICLLLIAAGVKSIGQRNAIEV